MAALLVLNHGRPVPRERIEEALWGESCPEKARDRLNTMLWRLRKALSASGCSGHRITNSRAALTYVADAPFECDAIDLGRMAKAVLRDGLSDSEHVDAALRCVEDCTTDFLPLCQDHWSMVTRESLRSAHLIILEALMRYMRRHERWARLSELAERMLAIDPTLEAGHRALINIHGERKDFGAAKRQYVVMQKIMDDSGVVPGPETASALDALKIAGKAGIARGKSRVLVRPSIPSVEAAIDHIEAAKTALLSQK